MYKIFSFINNKPHITVLVGAQPAAADSVLVGVKRVHCTHRVTGRLLHALEKRQTVCRHNFLLYHKHS